MKFYPQFRSEFFYAKAFNLFLMTFILLSLYASNGFASPEAVKHDSSEIILKHIPAHLLDEFKQDEDFFYDKIKSQDKLPWQLFVQKLINDLYSTIFSENENIFLKILFYALLFLLIIYFTYKIFKSDISSSFYADSDINIPELSGEENDIHIQNLDDLLQQNLAKKDYKKAIRIFILKR